MNELRTLTTDELLTMPYLENGDPGTQITLRPGALAEIRRRLQLLDHLLVEASQNPRLLHAILGK